MQKLQKSTAFLLLLVFALLLAPKELLHELHHSDTSDCFPVAGTDHQVDTAHHHCDALQLSTPVFTATCDTYSLTVLQPDTHLFQEVKRSPVTGTQGYSLLRGPPSA
jgi:hypothetical protein